jgi:hypothetical protein
MFDPAKDCCHLVGVNRFKDAMGITIPEISSELDMNNTLPEGT